MIRYSSISDITYVILWRLCFFFSCIENYQKVVIKYYSIHSFYEQNL